MLITVCPSQPYDRERRVSEMKRCYQEQDKLRPSLAKGGLVVLVLINQEKRGGV